MNMVNRIGAETRDVGAYDASARMGEMLRSAVRHGGLWDARWWPAWMDGVQANISLNGPLVAVEMSMDDWHRRWFADPITRLLIIKWHRDGLSLSAGADPEACIRRGAAVKIGDDGRAGPLLVDRARHSWEFRHPGIINAYAAGEIVATSAPTATWERVVHGIREVPETERVAQPRRQISTPKEDALKHFSPELAALRKPPRGYLAERDRPTAWKKAALSALRNLPKTDSALHRDLRAWCIFALEREPGRQSIGYAPSTVSNYLTALVRVFATWNGASPTEASPEVLKRHLVDILQQTHESRRNATIKAVQSLMRFFIQIMGYVPAAMDLNHYWREDRGAPDLVLPSEFMAIVRRLDGAGQDDLAMIVTLMFRAGLRINEAIGLRAGDFATSGDLFELTVEANEERDLKTKTSRRILPLDVLLDPHEVSRLRIRAQERARASRHGVEAWMFGPAMAVSPMSELHVARVITAEVKRVTGRTTVGHHHLRHSCASYLLATLMLPQDLAAPPVPERLKAVISPDRFHRVADRLLGTGRLGGGAVHAVSQLLGHTGPMTTLRYYCHLLDLSLGLYSLRPSSLVPANDEWLLRAVAIGKDARRKALARKKVMAPEPTPIDNRHFRPTAALIVAHTPNMDRKLAEAHLLNAGAARLARPLVRQLAGQRLPNAEEVKEHREHTRKRVCKPVLYLSGGHFVPWRMMIVALRDLSTRPANDGEGETFERWRRAADHLLGPSAQAPREERRWLDIPADRKFARFIDARLRLPRAPRADELRALNEVVQRWRRGQPGIRLSRLGNAEAFVGLLKAMGLKPPEIDLALSSRRGADMTSGQIHAFLAQRSTAPQLAGRAGWRGSLIVRVRPESLVNPTLATQAMRFALTALALNEASQGPMNGDRRSDQFTPIS